MKERSRHRIDARRALSPFSSRACASAALVLCVGSGCAGDDGVATSATASASTDTASDTSTGTTADETTGTGTGTGTGTSTSAGSDSASTSTGGSTNATDATDATTGETTGDTDGATYLVSGAVYRSADLVFAPGNDGVGPVTVGLVSDCTYPPVPFVFETIPDADLSDANAKVEYLLPASPGTHYLLATLDDNANDLIDSGDLIPAEGLTLKCVEVVITDADLEGVDIELDFVLP
ncbi:MAG: hypothetical protein KC486_21655 [Myxococcales bacterium]|nr:hypothetical protein [Myxococcales bacterium]